MKKSTIRSFFSILGIAGKIKLSFDKRNALNEIGWFKSYNTMSAINNKQEPIPWCTYSSIFFLEERINKSLDVFEYGSGNSTLWFSKRANKVVSVEHDKNWFNLLKDKIPGNATLIYHDIEINKLKYIQASSSNLYHIIFVDGRYRVKCIESSINSLNDNGIIILDNSEREKYKCIFSTLKHKGFKSLNFWGMAPGISEWSCTTIFYREKNCLNI